MNSSLQDRVVIVTGAAGGIGSETALEVARRGAAVVLMDRDADQLETVGQALADEGLDKHLSVAFDQSKTESVEAAVAECLSAFGPPDGLFANAGVGNFSPILELQDRDLERQINVNLVGTFRVCRKVAQEMVAAGKPGAMVLNASSGATQYTDQLAAYCASKAGVRMLAVGLASELGHHHIRVNCVLPGVIESPMTRPMLDDGSGHRERVLSRTPARRLGVPADVARLVCFLLSDDAGYITGSDVTIDGGQGIHGFPQWFDVDYS